MNEQTNDQVAFLEAFDDKVEDNLELSEQEKEQIASTISSEEEFRSILVPLKNRVADMNEKVSTADANIKQWQESKKMWKGRLELLLSILGKRVESLRIPGKSLNANGVKLSMRSNSVLEVDKEWLLQQFQPFVDAVKTQLPPFIKLTLDVDKRELSSYLNNVSNDLRINNPERIHTKPTSSLTIK